MEARISRDLPTADRGSVSLQKQAAENRRARGGESVPDLTDFMNDMFFGTVGPDRKVYNFRGDEAGTIIKNDDHCQNGFNSGRKSISSKSTQEWLEEAKKIVAQSPARSDSPSRLAGSPRFATSHSGPNLDKRNPLSRSARRHRASEGFGGEILSKSAEHNRKIPQAPPIPQEEESPASAVQKWFSNILKPQYGSGPTVKRNEPTNVPSDSLGLLPPKAPMDRPGAPPLQPHSQSAPRKSRFQKANGAPQTQLIPPSVNPTSAKRTFKTPANLNLTPTISQTLCDVPLLSPPKHLVESAARRSISSSTCSVPDSPARSPPRNLLDSSRRSVSVPREFLAGNLLESSRRSTSSTVATHNQDKVLPRDNFLAQFQAEEAKSLRLNGFLKEQRAKMEEVMNGETNARSKIVLSGAKNNTSSMVAAICYAWLLENRMRTDEEEREQGGTNGEIVVPVMNLRRGEMWKQKQAAWLFHHVGIDASALLFSDEVDLETLMMTRKLSILIVGQDILKTNGEVGSACTILTDNFCEDAYDLLQIPMMKKTLLAGILLDTQNLNASTKLCTTRDSEAIQLLLVGSAPTYRSILFDKLMLDQSDGAFYEILEKNYGKPPRESNNSEVPTTETQISDKNSDLKRLAPNADKIVKDIKNAKTNMESPNAANKSTDEAAADHTRGKNVSFLAKWFKFGSK